MQIRLDNGCIRPLPPLGIVPPWLPPPDDLIPLPGPVLDQKKIPLAMGVLYMQGESTARGFFPTISAGAGLDPAAGEQPPVPRIIAKHGGGLSLGYFTADSTPSPCFRSRSTTNFIHIQHAGSSHQ